jgi:hypothetical protein
MIEAREKTWGQYFPAMRGMLMKIDRCATDVKKIQTSTLVSRAHHPFKIRNNVATQLTMESERQRKLSEGMRNSAEILTAVVRSPTRMSPKISLAFLT